MHYQVCNFVKKKVCNNLRIHQIILHYYVIFVKLVFKIFKTNLYGEM